MKKWVCTVCGYVYEGEQAPEKFFLLVQHSLQNLFPDILRRHLRKTAFTLSYHRIPTPNVLTCTL